MLEHIPTYLIAGPLGAGKTSLLRQLLLQRPDAESWAILVNEFGQVGLDLALLNISAPQIHTAEVAGGCLCCVNGLPFQIGLGRLLRQARPDRVFIEASGLGHPADLLQQLALPPWQGVLAVQGLVMVLDAHSLAAGKPLPEAQQQALPDANLVLLNKSEQLDQSARQHVLNQLPEVNHHWTSQGHCSLRQLPVSMTAQHSAAAPSALPTGPAALTTLWRDPAVWYCQQHRQDAHHSIGWLMHPGQRFERGAIDRWLRSLSLQRAKGVLHTDHGWLSFNRAEGEVALWRSSEWRQDNRLELISAEPLVQATLEQGLRAAHIIDSR